MPVGVDGGTPRTEYCDLTVGDSDDDGFAAQPARGVDYAGDDDPVETAPLEADCQDKEDENTATEDLFIDMLWSTPVVPESVTFDGQTDVSNGVPGAGEAMCDSTASRPSEDSISMEGLSDTDDCEVPDAPARGGGTLKPWSRRGPPTFHRVSLGGWGR